MKTFIILLNRFPNLFYRDEFLHKIVFQHHSLNSSKLDDLRQMQKPLLVVKYPIQYICSCSVVPHPTTTNC